MTVGLSPRKTLTTDNRPLTTYTLHVFPAANQYIDPGRLIDGDLELVAPDTTWLDAAVAAENHLRTLREMPGGIEMSRDQYLEFIFECPRGFYAGDPDTGRPPSYHFWMIQRQATALPVVGGIGLRLGTDTEIERVIGHVGYHVYPFARGHHFAERACRLLLPLARWHGLMPLWITCNPENLASRRTCERLGAKLVDIVPVPPEHQLYDRGEREKCRYRWFGPLSPVFGGEGWGEEVF